MKVLLLTNIPTPYRIPFFNAIDGLLQEKGHEFKVVFAAKAYARRKWQLESTDFNFKSEFLEAAEIKGKTEENLTFSYRGIGKIIRKEKPSHVVVSGFSRGTLRVFLLSFFLRFTLILWTGTVASAKPESFLKRTYRKLILRKVSHFITYSQASKSYLQQLGAKAANISVALNTVDTDFFKTETERIKQTLPSHEGIKLTYVGYLSARKNVQVLLELVQDLLPAYPDIQLTIIGSGPEMENLQAWTETKGLAAQIEFAGYKQKHEIPAYFAQTDIFLFQTNEDIWGLVLNEAMAAGLACVASPNAVSARELIVPAVNGYCIDFEQKQEAKRCISELIDSPELRIKIGREAQRIMQQEASLSTSAQTFVEAILNA